jgi:hypothetical protein
VHPQQGRVGRFPCCGQAALDKAQARGEAAGAHPSAPAALGAPAGAADAERQLKQARPLCMRAAHEAHVRLQRPQRAQQAALQDFLAKG